MSRRSAAMASACAAMVSMTSWRSPSVVFLEGTVYRRSRQRAARRGLITITPCSTKTHPAPPRQVRGACPHDCPDTCALLTTVENGVATRVQGNPAHRADRRRALRQGRPNTPSAPTTPSASSPPRAAAPGSGQFTPVTWDEALADIAARLGALRSPRATRRPSSLYSYAGTMGLVQGESMDRRFFHRLGAVPDRTICATAGGEGWHTLGGKVGMKVEFCRIQAHPHLGQQLDWQQPAFLAHRPAGQAEWRQTGVHRPAQERNRREMPRAHPAPARHRRGAGAGADARTHRPRLARPRLHRAPHRGLGKLRERALQWPPERAPRRCGVPVEQIRQLARDYGATTQPAAIRLNYGMQRVHGGGGNAVRAVACLPALTGAWRHRAGGAAVQLGSFLTDRKAAAAPRICWPAAARAPSTWPRLATTCCANPRPPSARKIEALVVYNSNPGGRGARIGQGGAGLCREDLFTVVLEHFQTDTADYADYIPPATTQLEHWDVHLAYGHTDVLLNRPPLRPWARRAATRQVFRDLAARMGFTEPASRTATSSSAARPMAPRWTSTNCWSRACPLAGRTRRLPKGLSHAFRQVRILQRAPGCEGLDGLPDHVPNHEAAGTFRAVPAGHDLATGAQTSSTPPSSTSKPARHRGPPGAGDPPAGRRRAASRTAAWVRVFNGRAATASPRPRERTRPPGVVNGLGIWWRKLGLTAPTSTSSPARRRPTWGAGRRFTTARGLDPK